MFGLANHVPDGTPNDTTRRLVAESGETDMSGLIANYEIHRR